MTVGKYYDMEDEPQVKTQTKKPEWYHTNFPFDLAKWIVTNRIVEIKYESKIEADWNATYYAILIAEDKSTRKIAGWHHYLKMSANHRGLVEIEQHVINDVQKILDWEKAHKRKIDQFKKLKAELGL